MHAWDFLLSGKCLAPVIFFLVSARSGSFRVAMPCWPVTNLPSAAAVREPNGVLTGRAEKGHLCRTSHRGLDVTLCKGGE